MQRREGDRIMPSFGRIRLAIWTVAAIAVTLACGLFIYQSLGDAPPPPEKLGWLGTEQAQRDWAEVKNSKGFVPFRVTGPNGEFTQADTAKPALLWIFTKEVNGGEHLGTRDQEVGDCVGNGATSAIDYTLATQIVVENTRQKFARSHVCYTYGISRVQILRNQIRGDGSTGAAAAAAALQFGCLPENGPEVPPYSGTLSREWGRSPGVPKKFIDLAKKNPVKSAAKVTTIDQVITALQSGYGISIASNVGFSMKAWPRTINGVKRLYNEPRGQWAHQMCIIGYIPGDSKSPEGYFYDLNSWGETAHGAPLDDAPPGGFWISASAMKRILAADDTFAFSGIEGFKRRQINFDVWEMRLKRDREEAALAEQRRRIADTTPIWSTPTKSLWFEGALDNVPAVPLFHLAF